MGSRAQAPTAFTYPDPRCPLPKASAQPPSSLGPLTPKLPLDPSSSLRVQLLRNAALKGKNNPRGLQQIRRKEGVLAWPTRPVGTTNFLTGGVSGHPS